MLRQCEFNGRKDILHFKLLQAAINENNVNKIPDKNTGNMRGKFVGSQDYLDDHQKLSGNYEQGGSDNQYNFDNGEDDINHEQRSKKKRGSSSLLESRSKRKHESSFIPMEHHSKRKHENPFISKIRSSSEQKRSGGLNGVLPLSKNKKMLKNVHNLIKH